jgi:DNA-binding transcriptional MerR regulator
MPYKEKEIEKIYYSIGEVADLLQVNTSHIRFWSNEFDVIRPSTNKKGNRMYTQSDIDNLRKIYHLVKEKGFTLKGAKSELKKMAAAGKPAAQQPEALQPEMQQQEEQQPVSQAAEPLQPESPQPAAKVSGQARLFDLPSSEMAGASATESKEVNIVDKIAVLNSLQKMRVALLEAQDQLTQLESRRTQ